MAAAKPKYLLRLADRGTRAGVPVVGVYLVRRTGPAEAGLMASRELSPKTADEIAAWFAELGVQVERVPEPKTEEPAR